VSDPATQVVRRAGRHGFQRCPIPHFTKRHLRRQVYRANSQGMSAAVEMGLPEVRPCLFYRANQPPSPASVRVPLTSR